MIGTEIGKSPCDPIPPLHQRLFRVKLYERSVIGGELENMRKEEAVAYLEYWSGMHLEEL